MDEELVERERLKYYGWPLGKHRSVEAELFTINSEEGELLLDVLERAKTAAAEEPLMRGMEYEIYITHEASYEDCSGAYVVARRAETDAEVEQRDARQLEETRKRLASRVDSDLRKLAELRARYPDAEI